MKPHIDPFANKLRRRIRRTPAAVRLYLHKLLYSLPEIELESLVGRISQVEPPILDDICMPISAEPQGHDDFMSLMNIVNYIQPRIVIELGTAHGNTVANICRQCPQAVVYTVNAPLEEQTGQVVTYELSSDEIGRVYRKHGYADRVTQIFKNTLSLNLSEYLDGQAADLALIDACHDADYVINDFLKTKPFVRPGGIVLFHDTHPSMEGHLQGSYMACMYLRRKGYGIRHIRGTWWAVWVNEDKNRVF